MVSFALFDAGVGLSRPPNRCCCSDHWHCPLRPSTALILVARMVAAKLRTGEALRYEAALRGISACLESLHTETPTAP